MQLKNCGMAGDEGGHQYLLPYLREPAPGAQGPLQKAKARENDHTHRSVRATGTQRHAEPSRVTDGDVGSELSGRLEHGQGQEVCRDGEEAPKLVSLIGDLLPVDDLASGVGVLHHGSEDVLLEGRVTLVPFSETEGTSDTVDFDLDAKRLRSSAKDGDRLGQYTSVDEIGRLFASGLVESHDHSFGGSRCLVCAACA